jgi:glucan phosphorylase
VDDAPFLAAYAAPSAPTRRTLSIGRAPSMVSTSTPTMFDVQIKRMHEYKRQHHEHP